MNTRAIRSALIRTLGVALALASGSVLATSFRLTDLGTLGGSQSWGTALNASGQVTGNSDAADGHQHAFLWDGTTMQDLGTLGSTISQGFAINAAGQVAGDSTTAGGEQHAFLWDGTTMQDLGTLPGGAYSSGAAINDAGQVTGLASTTGNAGSHAFLWDGTTMQNLNDLIAPSDPLQPFVELRAATDINDAGQILVQGVNRRTGSVNSMFLLSPVSVTVAEPGTLALLGLGLAGLGLTRRRRAN